MTVLVVDCIWTTNVRPSCGHFARCRDEKREICSGICSGLLQFVADFTIWTSSLLCESVAQPVKNLIWTSFLILSRGSWEWMPCIAQKPRTFTGVFGVEFYAAWLMVLVAITHKHCFAKKKLGSETSLVVSVLHNLHPCRAVSDVMCKIFPTWKGTLDTAQCSIKNTASFSCIW